MYSERGSVCGAGATRQHEWSPQNLLWEIETMTNLMRNALVRLHNDEAGQGLVEYLLILALVAFAATAGMNTLAAGLTSALAKVGNIIWPYISWCRTLPRAPVLAKRPAQLGVCASLI